ncbi:FliH/SctL family protein [Dyella psychrodurans]|uniref:Flagellar assembly protein FliH n=1 Tax=Dyella psychrodurans TaxID=1927960 RepID=A0A370X0N6_9GAMM|nr:FliH/SctL family protein [Dyella psychrodurans]RDS81850.1 flagellar assembly protein FliH [Dyella psychrodurans]
MVGVLSRDKISGFDRWEPPTMGEPATRAAEPEAAPGPTVYELEEIERQAREEGYAAGVAEGRAAAKQQLDERLARLDAICTAAARPLTSFDDATERELALLATVIAQRVVGRELQLDPSLIAIAVREAAAALPAATRDVRVWVNPHDMDLLRELGAGEPHWRFGADPALKRGDCVLESERSRLDARVSTRLAAVVDAVLGDDLDDGEAEVAP